MSATGTEISPGRDLERLHDDVPTREPHDSNCSRVRFGRPGQYPFFAQLVVNGHHVTVKGEGNGPIDALMDGLRTEMDVKFSVRDYSEHALTSGSAASAVA